MDAARSTTRRTGESATTASHQLARLASEGFGAVLPISYQAERSLTRFIETALRGQGVLALLGKSTLLVGAAFAAFELGKKAREFLELGTTVARYMEEVKKASEEQKTFIVQLSKQSDVLRGLDKDLRALKEPSLAGIFKDVAEARETRDDAIRKAFGPEFDPSKRAAALAKSATVAVEQEKKVLDDFRKLRDEADQKLLDTILGERETFEKANVAAATALGLGGKGLVEGFRDIKQLQSDLVDFQASIRDLARAGIPARDIFDEITRAQGGFDAKMGELEERFKVSSTKPRTPPRASTRRGRPRSAGPASWPSTSPRCSGRRSHQERTPRTDRSSR